MSKVTLLIFLTPSLYIFFLCMCVVLFNECEFFITYVFVCACGGQKLMSSIAHHTCLSVCLSICLFWDRIFHWTWNWLTWEDFWPGSSRFPFVFTLLELALEAGTAICQEYRHAPWHLSFCVSWDLNSGLHYLYDKHLTDWAIFSSFPFLLYSLH